MRRFLIGVEDWIDDESMILSMLKFLLVFGGASVLVIACLMWMFPDTREQRCLDAGGAWAITGSHTGLVMVGKIMMPTRITDYGCIQKYKNTE